MRAEELSGKLLIADDVWESRDYLGMSQIGGCPRWLYTKMTNGQGQPGGRALLAMHEGRMHREDILERLLQAQVRVTGRGRELVAGFDERFRGHIVGEVDGDALGIKTVRDWEALNQVVEDGPRPRDRDQMQMYLRYGGYRRGLIIYKERQGGEVWVCWVSLDVARGRWLEEKARRVLAAVDAGEPPECECGRCDD